MALNSIGILIALCVATAFAVDEEIKTPPEHGHYHGPNNPNYPARVESRNIHRGHHGHKPHFPDSSEESEESKENWGYTKPHHHGWHISHSPHLHQYPKKSMSELERRRPIFFPYHPIHPFYPHAHPSHNDEEFETIEALKRRNYHGSHNPNSPLIQNNFQESNEQQGYKGPFYHGLHNPHFPLNSDSSEESSENILNRPFYHGHHFPHFNPFHKEPVHENPETNDIFESNEENFNAASEEKEQFKIPSILIDLHELLHHGHTKPPVEVPLKEDESDEGSGEEDIILLTNTFDIPLIKEDTKIEDQNDEQDEENVPSDVIPTIGFRSFLESRKSIPVVCDALNTPRYSCYNCYNYLVCKPEGGKIKACKDPYAPYCNNGICSDTPGPECSNL